MTTFALDLNRAIEKAKDKAETAVKKITLDLFKSVIKMSPVKTGRFRNNWNSAIGTADYSTTEEVDPSGSNAISRAEAVIANYKLDGKSIFLTNNLPYAKRLEEGWSQKQAPQGMVRLSLLSIGRKYGT